MTATDRAATLRQLHEDPELLVLVNVWDVASARVVAAVPGCRALATASHAIAAMYGYEDGENIPRELMLEAVGRIAAAVDLPVTADLEAGYGDAAETIRRAISVGVVGANLEDQMRPFDEAVAAVRSAVDVGSAEGLDFVLNARTDAFLLAGDREPEAVLAEAIERGRAFLDVGATCVFVPGVKDETVIKRLVDGLGAQKVSLIAGPGSPPPATLQDLGVARVSQGPWSQRLALTALADASAAVYGGSAFPEGIRPLT